MLTMSPASYEHQMWWILHGLTGDGLLLLFNEDITPDELYYTYRALGHIANQYLAMPGRIK
jgi:hypothetical protein